VFFLYNCELVCHSFPGARVFGLYLIPLYSWKCLVVTVSAPCRAWFIAYECVCGMFRSTVYMKVQGVLYVGSAEVH
jgi:hypothetical protein